MASTAALPLKVGASARDLESSDDGTASSEEEVRYRDVHLQGTCYDATTLAMIAALDDEYIELHGCGPTAAQLVLAICLHFTSIAFQLVIIFYLLVTAVEAKEKPYRHDLADEISALEGAMAAGVPINMTTAGDAALGALELCKLKKALPWSHMLILFLWFSKISGELIEAWSRANILLKLPAPEDPGDLMSEQKRATEAGGSARIHSAPFKLKAFFTVVVIIPQFFAGMFLMWTGAKFLYFTPDMPTLIMKSLGLAFIVSLDELMYNTFASSRFKMLVKNTSYKVRCAKVNWHYEMWGASVAKAVAIMSLSLITYFWVFGHVTELRKACDDYITMFPPANYETVWTHFMKSMGMQLPSRL